ncbi:MAG: phosphoadenylyl-sulfate reductase, partial [Nocardioides sp.]
MDYREALSHTMGVLTRVSTDFRPAVLANAFGPESLVMTDLISRHGLDIEIVSIDTGRLPEETQALAHSVHQRYGPVITMLGPDADEVSAWTRAHGQNGFYDAVELRLGCCDVRKVQPLRRALAGKRAWLTGLRREQSALRRDLSVESWDESYGLHKFSPMLDWTSDQVWSYIHEHRVPYNKLHDRGYTSIGCAPCTRAVATDEDPRAGRWWWEMESAKECGIHLDPTTGQLSRRRDVQVAADDSSEPPAGIIRPGSEATAPLEAVPEHHEGNKMRVLILGGDGFCGWPTALHLSAQGHEVAIVDNLSRRKIDIELEVSSLTPIRPMGERLRAWKDVSGKDIAFHNFDVAENYHRLLTLLEDWRPDALVHFAEQRAAPYSMKSSRHKRYTVSNNLNATNNVLAAVVESGLDVHIAHLGTMGVYGYGTAGMKIPEGYLQVKVETADGLVDQEILYPANPGSIYHMTKTQ